MTQQERDKYYEQFDGLRTQIGQIYYGDDFAPGHNYDDGEELMRQFIDLIVAKMPLPTDLTLRQDGNMWMCVHGDFENLQESPSWWGETPELALAAYRTEAK